jgi:hypothetical protein
MVSKWIVSFFNKIGSCLKSAVIYFDQDSVSVPSSDLLSQLPKINWRLYFFSFHPDFWQEKWITKIIKGLFF